MSNLTVDVAYSTRLRANGSNVVRETSSDGALAAMEM